MFVVALVASSSLVSRPPTGAGLVARVAVAARTRCSYPRVRCRCGWLSPVAPLPSSGACSTGTGLVGRPCLATSARPRDVAEVQDVLLVPDVGDDRLSAIWSLDVRVGKEFRADGYTVTWTSTGSTC